MPGSPVQVEKLWNQSAKAAGTPSQRAITASAAGASENSARCRKKRLGGDSGVRLLLVFSELADEIEDDGDIVGSRVVNTEV
jgi:hypothetical protein